MVWFLIGLGVSLWIIQGIFGFVQIKKFNRELRALREMGKVAIGKSRGKLRAGCLLMLCIDDDAKIIKGRIMQGVTSFAGFKDFDVLNGIYITEINDGLGKALKLDIQVRKAMLAALKDYEDYHKQLLEKEAEKEAQADTDASE